MTSEGRAVTPAVLTGLGGAGGRALAVAAVIAAAVLAGLLLFGRGGYRVEARFLSAGQLVEGNVVRISGTQVGTVEDISIAGNGEAVAELSIDDEDISPLPVGTRATIRQFSQSGSASRHVNLGSLEMREAARRAEADRFAAGSADGAKASASPMTRWSSSTATEGTR